MGALLSQCPVASVLGSSEDQASGLGGPTPSPEHPHGLSMIMRSKMPGRPLPEVS